MIVTLKEFNDGTLFANVDNFTGFFDRRLKNINYDPGDEVDVIFTGISKKFLFMIPVKSNYKLLRHKGFKPTGPTWDIMAEAIFPKRSFRHADLEYRHLCKILDCDNKNIDVDRLLHRF